MRVEAMAGGLEKLTLRELLPLWCGMVWWSSIRPLLQRMVQADLTMAESVALHGLQRGPLTVTEVAGCLGITQSAASRAVDRLVRDGFVGRQEHPADRRQKLLTLTPTGEALLGEVETLLARGAEPLTAVLDSEDQERLRSLLTRMIAPQIGPWCGPLDPVSSRDEAAPATL